MEWKFDDKSILGIPEIDAQHKIWFGYINEFERNKNPKDALIQLEVYSIVHFSLEEKYFKLFKYEGAAEHIKIHEGFKKKLEKFKSQIEDEKLVKEIGVFLRQWIIEHIRKIDRKYVKCFREHGL